MVIAFSAVASQAPAPRPHGARATAALIRGSACLGNFGFDAALSDRTLPGGAFGAATLASEKPAPSTFIRPYPPIEYPTTAVRDASARPARKLPLPARDSRSISSSANS